MNASFIRYRTRAALKVLLTESDPTHYEVLGVSPGALDELTLRKARAHLALMFHPDRNVAPDGTEFENRRAHDFTARANVAHGVLRDRAARQAYDASLRTTHLPCAKCEGKGLNLKTRGFSRVDRVQCEVCGGGGWMKKGTKK